MISANQVEFDIDEPLFPLTVGSEAAGAIHSTYRMYANARRAPLDRDLRQQGTDAKAPLLGSPGAKKGLATLLTFRGVLTYSAATPLIRAGMPVGRAQEAALVWTGDRSGLKHSSRMADLPPPAQLYPDPLRTLLCHRNGFTWISPARSEYDELILPFTLSEDVPAVLTIVNLNTVFVRSRLHCERYLVGKRTWP